MSSLGLCLKFNLSIRSSSDFTPTLIAFRESTLKLLLETVVGFLAPIVTPDLYPKLDVVGRTFIAVVLLEETATPLSLTPTMVALGCPVLAPSATVDAAVLLDLWIGAEAAVPGRDEEAVRVPLRGAVVLLVVVKGLLVGFIRVACVVDIVVADDPVTSFPAFKTGFDIFRGGNGFAGPRIEQRGSSSSVQKCLRRPTHVITRWILRT